jgi:response regulator of citrate/malate metabolism
LQQRSFDHLDSTEIKTNYRNFNRFKAFKSILSFYAAKFCLLEGTRDLNQSVFDNIVETKEQQRQKTFNQDLLKIKLTKIKQTVSG